MSIRDVVGLKFPKLPRDLDDKALEKLVPKLEKEFADFLKSAQALHKEYNSLTTTLIQVQDASIDKATDKKLDPKQAKLALAFRSEYEKFHRVLMDFL